MLPGAEPEPKRTAPGAAVVALLGSGSRWVWTEGESGAGAIRHAATATTDARMARAAGSQRARSFRRAERLKREERGNTPGDYPVGADPVVAG